VPNLTNKGANKNGELRKSSIQQQFISENDNRGPNLPEKGQKGS